MLVTSPCNWLGSGRMLLAMIHARDVALQLARTVNDEILLCFNILRSNVVIIQRGLERLSAAEWLKWTLPF